MSRVRAPDREFILSFLIFVIAVGVPHDMNQSRMRKVARLN